MRYRRMTADGDYVFGPASLFLVDSPEAVAQAIRTRLQLYVTEWFLDMREGLNLNLILGYGTQTTRDREIQERIGLTPGVNRILSYASSMDAARGLHVTSTVDTIYGVVTVDTNMTLTRG